MNQLVVCSVKGESEQVSQLTRACLTSCSEYNSCSMVIEFIPRSELGGSWSEIRERSLQGERAYQVGRVSTLILGSRTRSAALILLATIDQVWLARETVSLDSSLGDFIWKSGWQAGYLAGQSSGSQLHVAVLACFSLASVGCPWEFILESDKTASILLFLDLRFTSLTCRLSTGSSVS